MSTLPHWIVVERASHTVIESKLLPPGTDLLEAFLELLLQYHRAGWLLNEFTSNTAHFFCSKDGEHRYVQITPEDPAKPKPLSVGLYGPSRK